MLFDEPFRNRQTEATAKLARRPWASATIKSLEHLGYFLGWNAQTLVAYRNLCMPVHNGHIHVHRAIARRIFYGIVQNYDESLFEPLRVGSDPNRTGAVGRLDRDALGAPEDFALVDRIGDDAHEVRSAGLEADCIGFRTRQKNEIVDEASHLQALSDNPFERIAVHCLWL